MLNSEVVQTLSSIGAIDIKRLELLHPRTRDSESPVYRDPVTNVIVLGDVYGGDAQYRQAGSTLINDELAGPEEVRDTERRIEAYGRFAEGRNVLDFGCGSGAFLRKINAVAARAVGVELRQSTVAALQREGIQVVSSLTELSEEFNVAYLFHVLEHLEKPLETLENLRGQLQPNSGTLIIEVPSANDLLIRLRSTSFLDFTFWSQHLVLHTRDSLERLITAAGFEVQLIGGVQRYPVSNHLGWLSRGTPGSHNTWLSMLDSPQLHSIYADRLAAVDATDTLVAVATLP